MNNKAMGSALERQFAEKLYQHGYWVHLMQQSAKGQPADVIAVKNGKAQLIDCKNCANDYFDVKRIELNQRTAMHLWQECDNGPGWFAIKLNNTVWMCELWKLELSDFVRMRQSWFEQNCVTLERWLEEGGH